MRWALAILLLPACRWDVDRDGVVADGPGGGDGPAAALDGMPAADGAAADGIPFVVDASAACVQAWAQPGCPTPYAPVNGSCYRYVMATVLWAEAEAACAADCAHLAVITDSLENQVVRDSLLNDDTWIGLTFRDGGWRWVTGEPFAYQNWDPAGEPVTLECAKMNDDLGTWDGKSCTSGTQMDPFICEYDRRPASP